MISTTIEQSVMNLPMPDRAHLAHLLLCSLDETSDTEIQDHWLDEAKRRARQIDVGTVNLVSGEILEQQVQALFK
jgi:Putative addiction module component